MPDMNRQVAVTGPFGFSLPVKGDEYQVFYLFFSFK
jgi:hypothetical protein